LFDENATTPNDRAEVVVTDETDGHHATVNDEKRLLVQTLFDSSALDAFERLKVSQPETLFNCTHRDGKRSELWTEKLTGSATSTHDSNKVSVKLSTTTASGDKAERRTRQYFPYFPGKSQQLKLTGNFGSGIANCRRRFGLYDSEDGLFFEIDGTTNYVVVRSKTTGSVVDTRVAQSSWNLDKLDGTGASGITVDFSKQLILSIQYQWLGSGSVYYGVVVDGRTYWAHRADHSNILTTPYTRTGTLPVACEIENTGVVGSAQDLFFTCAELATDGGDPNYGDVRSVSNAVTAITLNDSSYLPLLAIRLKTTHQKYAVRLLRANVSLVTGNNPVHIQVLHDATITGGSWADATSYAQVNKTGTAVSGGTEISNNHLFTQGNIASSFGDEIPSNLHLGSNFAGTSDIIALVGKMVAGSGDALGSLILREFE
jgi:hypothetical protein